MEDLEDDIVLCYDDSKESNDSPKIGTELSREQKTTLQQLLHDSSDVLQDNPGRTHQIEHRIDMKSSSPIRLPPYRLPHAYHDSVRTDLKEMEASGSIEPSTSVWAFPIVLVKKKDGTMRMCVDYRRLNEHARIDAYPMPRVDDLIDRLGKAKFITTLDLARGYWQVPMAEEARPLTAFVTPFGLYQFRVMPFGLSGAPATFQRLMDQVIRGLHDFSAAYLDKFGSSLTDSVKLV